jgi:tetratricopeptide (TPR) repeat protein
MANLSHIIQFTAFLGFLILVGCATVQKQEVSATSLFRDGYFEPRQRSFDVDSVFELSPEMHTYLRNDVQAANRGQTRGKKLLQSLYDQDKLRLEYDSSYTRNAREAFEARSGNCLSLVLMTAAFAKQLNLIVRYQSVFTPDNVSRGDGVVYYSDHVNLLIGQADVSMAMANANEPSLLVDFIDPGQTVSLRTLPISEKTVIAMYTNNRAAEELRDKRRDEAYWWVRDAITADPAFLPSYNTLGLIYERDGHLAEAEQALRHVIEIEPDNHAALANLKRITLKRGKTEESEQFAKRLVAVKPIPPFHYFDIGMAAMRNKDYQLARDNFLLEIGRAAYNPEFHFWLSGAYIGLNEPERAKKHLIIARDNAITTIDREMYIDKLKAFQVPSKH